MSTPRDRLVETARQLFLERGVPKVGINEVTARAKVARMTLYNNFPSKDDLVLAVFEQEAQMRRDAIEAVQSELDEPLARILALFVVAKEIASLNGFRGCAFINLAIEAAAPNSAMHALAKKHKAWVRTNCMQTLMAGGYTNSERLADQILVLWDGGVVGAYVHQSTVPIDAARDAVQTLLSHEMPA